MNKTVGKVAVTGFLFTAAIIFFYYYENNNKKLKKTIRGGIGGCIKDNIEIEPESVFLKLLNPQDNTNYFLSWKKDRFDENLRKRIYILECSPFKNPRCKFILYSDEETKYVKSNYNTKEEDTIQLLNETNNKTYNLKTKDGYVHLSSDGQIVIKKNVEDDIAKFILTYS